MPISVPITIAFANTSSFVPAAPIQRQFQLDFTNPNYVRNAQLTQDTLYLTFSTCSVLIPLANLYAVATSVLPQLGWPPLIITQPTSSTVTHPTSSFFYVSASSFTTPSYQWYSSSYSQSFSGSFVPLTASTQYSGVTSSLLGYLTSSVLDNSASFKCLVSNVSGFTYTNTANISIL